MTHDRAPYFFVRTTASGFQTKARNGYSLFFNGFIPETPTPVVASVSRWIHNTPVWDLNIPGSERSNVPQGLNQRGHAPWH